MISVDINKLNPLERKIHQTLSDAVLQGQELKINQAAQLCQCSLSKISKFVKKLGFENYKQYMLYIGGKQIPQKKTSGELERIQNFLETFELSMVDEFVEMIQTHEKIILLGYGPSYICAQYLEYKLRFLSDKNVVAIPDENMAIKIMDNKSLMVVFSTSGKFASFENIADNAKEKGCRMLMIVEEYNTSLIDKYDKIFFLTKSYQSEDLIHYEKTRTVFFIFIEEVLLHLIEEDKQREDS